jgi:hypothetical protein
VKPVFGVTSACALIAKPIVTGETDIVEFLCKCLCVGIVQKEGRLMEISWLVLAMSWVIAFCLGVLAMGLISANKCNDCIAMRACAKREEKRIAEAETVLYPEAWAKSPK